MALFDLDALDFNTKESASLKSNYIDDNSMDAMQKSINETAKKHSMVVTGSAGSGKSLIAAKLAKHFFTKESNLKILVLTYTKSLNLNMAQSFLEEICQGDIERLNSLNSQYINTTSDRDKKSFYFQSNLIDNKKNNNEISFFYKRSFDKLYLDSKKNFTNVFDFDIVIVDEVQDLEMDFIKNLALIFMYKLLQKEGKDLNEVFANKPFSLQDYRGFYLFGDDNQAIYSKENLCLLDDLATLLNLNKYVLTYNYRLPKSIAKYALDKCLHDDFNEFNYKSKALSQVSSQSFSSINELTQAIQNTIKSKNLKNVAILTFQNESLKELSSLFKEQNFDHELKINYKSKTAVQSAKSTTILDLKEVQDLVSLFKNDLLNAFKELFKGDVEDNLDKLDDDCLTLLQVFLEEDKSYMENLHKDESYINLYNNLKNLTDKDKFLNSYEFAILKDLYGIDRVESTDKGSDLSSMDINFLSDKAKALTIHSAKGLQFDNVFLVCMKKSKSSRLIQNIYYVAMTRTLKNLYIYTLKDLKPDFM